MLRFLHRFLMTVSMLTLGLHLHAQASGVLLSPVQTVIGLLDLSSYGISSSTKVHIQMKDALRLARQDAKVFLQNGQMSDFLAEVMDDLSKKSIEAGIKNADRLSDRELAFEIYTYPVK